MEILLIGGAGYIGSHMVRLLRNHGHHVSIVDNLSTGHLDLPTNQNLFIGDIADPIFLANVFKSRNFNLVMHFAACSIVSESLLNPSKYYRNNISSTLTLLDLMISSGVKKFIFSSTAAIFGEPHFLPIDESHPKNAINPYGRSKYFVEQILDDYDAAYGLKSICFRYFNAAGADPVGDIGEKHDPETHLIPLVLQVASGLRDSISIYGDDYDTVDGTCVRDYIHVCDLCEAHMLGIEFLEKNNASSKFNLGYGHGYSVKSVIDTSSKITARHIKVNYANRRAGDPATLIADSNAAREILGWKPRFDSLDVIVEHAWRWELSLRNLK
jgi:UDP-glucose 4-epimerase